MKLNSEVDLNEKSTSILNLNHEEKAISILTDKIPKETISDYLRNSIRLFVKRFIDIVVSLIGCVFIIPLTVLIKIAYMVTGDFNSVFYTQERIGKNGKVFKMLKYRTMVVNSDDVLNNMMKDEQYKKDWELYHKLKKDPRITKVGKILRIASLDEVPQLINILKGEMSFIGNRPYMLKEKEAMGEYYENIIKTKPGLTGVWQTSGRSDITFNERLILESDYSDNCNLIWDLKIFLKTIHVVFKRTGSR